MGWDGPVPAGSRSSSLPSVRAVRPRGGPALGLGVEGLRRQAGANGPCRATDRVSPVEKRPGRRSLSSLCFASEAFGSAATRD